MAQEVEYPSNYSLKVFGDKSSGFEEEVFKILEQNLVLEKQTSKRPSANGKYLALTVKFEAKNKKQLDDIYKSLTDNPKILMAL